MISSAEKIGLLLAVHRLLCAVCCVCSCEISAFDQLKLFCLFCSWSNEFCRCMCTNPRTCNNKRQYFDEETCSCKCNSRKKDCQAFGRTFDLDSCACRRTSRSENHLNGQQGSYIKTVFSSLVGLAIRELSLLIAGRGWKQFETLSKKL